MRSLLLILALTITVSAQSRPVPEEFRDVFVKTYDDLRVQLAADEQYWRLKTAQGLARTARNIADIECQLKAEKDPWKRFWLEQKLQSEHRLRKYYLHQHEMNVLFGLNEERHPRRVLGVSPPSSPAN